MNAWRVGDAHVGVVFVRAETRAQARRSWPGQEYAAVPVHRAPRLDGPGPARELDVVYDLCTDDDEDCFDGERMDWARTIAAAGGTGDD